MHNKKTRSGRCSIWYVCPDSTAIWSCICAFPCGSLSLEATVIVSFASRQRSGNMCVECSANFFEQHLVDFHVPLPKNSDRLHALENANQMIRVAVPQKKFAIFICLYHFSFLERAPEEFWRCRLDTRMAHWSEFRPQWPKNLP